MHMPNRQLKKRKSVCCQCVQGLQQWQGLQQQWCRAAPLSTSQQLEAAAAVAWRVQRLETQQAVQQLLLDDQVKTKSMLQQPQFMHIALLLWRACHSD
jgi:hypothetical protein